MSSWYPPHTAPLKEFPAQLKRIADETDAKLSARNAYVFWTGPVTANTDGRFYVSFPQLRSLVGCIVQPAHPGLGGYTQTPPTDASGTADVSWVQANVGVIGLGPQGNLEWFQFFGQNYSYGLKLRRPVGYQIAVLGWGPAA